MEIVYVLGRAGSGKSTVAQKITTWAKTQERETIHLYDYSFLEKRFRQEIDDCPPEELRVFKKVESGFDVVKFEVLNEVLQEMASEVKQKREDGSYSDCLFVIEFARREYGKALDIFNQQGLLDNSFLLYVNLDVKICIQRVHQRTIENPCPKRFDHFVSDGIMQDYYSWDDWNSEDIAQYLDNIRRDGLAIETGQIENDRSVQELDCEIITTLSEADKALKDAKRHLATV